MAQEHAARRSGRPPLTDRPAILAAARSHGFAGLTVGLVTAAVGVKYSTFYRHFSSLDALIVALADDVLEHELVLPDDGKDWQDYLGESCAALTRLLSRYPGMAAAMVSLPELPDQVVSVYRRLTDALLAAGFDAEHASLGAVCALETVTITELTTPGVGHSLAGRQRDLETHQPPVADDVRAVTARLADEPTGAWTGRKIQLLIRGLAVELAEAPPTG